MSGHIIPNSNIAIDFWKRRGISTKSIHFLTHYHGDHIVGLTSSWQEPIFCSEITAYLLIERHGIPKSLLNILPLNESVIIEVSESENFTVTTYNANHCPGAVMFFFEGNFGNVLYTGDFRLSEEILQTCHNLSEKVDLLYLDNTYCSPQCIFPSQKECLNQIIDIIKQHPDHRVLIGVRKLGKETLLGQLGVILNETISVSPECYKLCNVLFATDVFTTSGLSKNITRLSTVPIGTMLSNLSALNRISPTIGIIPTAIFTGCSSDFQDSSIFVVPYSDHSSYTELISFVTALKPCKIVPIVTDTKGPFDSDLSDRLNMSCFDAFLSLPRIKTVESNSGVKANYISHRKAKKYYKTRNTFLGTSKKKLSRVKDNPKKKANGVVYIEDEIEIEEPVPHLEGIVIDLSTDSEHENNDVNIIENDKRGADKLITAGNSNTLSPNHNPWQMTHQGHNEAETSSSKETVSSNLPKKSTASKLLNETGGKNKEIKLTNNNSSNVIEMDDAHLRSLISSAVFSALLPLKYKCHMNDHNDAGKSDKDADKNGCAAPPQCSKGNTLPCTSQDYRNKRCLRRKRKVDMCSGESNVENKVSTDPKRLVHFSHGPEMAEGGKVLSDSSSKQTEEQPHSSGSLETSKEPTKAEKNNLSSVNKTLTPGPGKHNSTLANEIQFCPDCFGKVFCRTSVETKNKQCFVCEKSIVGCKINVGDLFVKMLKKKFFNDDSQDN